MEDMNLKTEDVAIFHFDGSKYKPLDIIKDGWDAKMQSNVKSKKDPDVLQVPISSFKKNTYEPYKDEINKFVEIYNKENPAEIQPTQTLQINNKKQSFANKSKSKTFKKSKSKTFTHTQKKSKK
jgi:Fe-S cluster biosynthesis and repair protein YggX